MDLDFTHIALYVAYFVLGAVVSLINSVAGGGSTLSLPIMILLGLPATVANGTNRLGFIIGNFSSAFNLARHGDLNMKLFLQLRCQLLVFIVYAEGRKSNGIVFSNNI